MRQSMSLGSEDTEGGEEERPLETDEVLDDDEEEGVDDDIYLQIDEDCIGFSSHTHINQELLKSVAVICKDAIAHMQ